MHGQWVGRYEGSNSGDVMVDIDLREGYFSGTGVLFDDLGLPGSRVSFETTDFSSTQSFSGLTISPIDPQNAEEISLDLLKRRYLEQGENLNFPQRADVNLSLKDDQLTIRWKTEIGSHGFATLPKSNAKSPSDIKPREEVKNWADFKATVNSLNRNRFIFRGQPSVWRLQTAFHRTNRKDAFRFMSEDIPSLHRRLSGLTKHFFNLSDGQQNGAFWNLAQHHGYPTPLLDWSNSPFVAAFFAYRNLRLHENSSEKVRIYAFDKQSWCRDFQQFYKVAPMKPHFSILETLALENPRSVPQQALSSITNIDDIETYITDQERAQNKTYLTAYDLNAADFDLVIGDLALMGITPGALFPGIDGACEELKYRNFGYLGQS